MADRRICEELGGLPECVGSGSRSVGSMYGTLHLEKKVMDAFAGMAAICKASDIKFKCFAGPLHPAALVPIWDSGGREFYAAWLQQLGAIGPFYSFTLMDEAWDHKLSDRKDGWSDTTHFTPRAGAIILRDLACGAPRVGRLIDSQSYADHIAELDRRLHRWIADNPDYTRLSLAR